MHPAFSRTDHRPWTAPSSRWTWRQSWRDLLFAHWPVPASLVRKLVPEPLEVEEFEGTSWVGVVPFRMTGVMRRPLPDMPWISAFPELNVRLYVRFQDKPGVWFLSLDATNALAVWAARRFFHLPYHRAAMSLTPDRDGIVYASRRANGSVEFRAWYRPTNDVYESPRGTLEHWLTERYCLYAQAPNGSLWRTQVHHAPWPLQRAEARIDCNDMTTPHGIPLSGAPSFLHFSRRLDVVVWSPEPVAD